MSLQRLDDPSLKLTAQYNPTEITQAYGANYARLAVPGLSHQVKHFANTNDVTMKFGLDFVVDDGGESAADALIAARLFFATSVRPKARVGNVASSGAPRLYLFWPNFFSMTCVLTNADLKFTQFNRSARPTRMRADVTVEEIRDAVILADQFFDEAPLRASAR